MCVIINLYSASLLLITHQQSNNNEILQEAINSNAIICFKIPFLLLNMNLNSHSDHFNDYCFTEGIECGLFNPAESAD